MIISRVSVSASGDALSLCAARVPLPCPEGAVVEGIAHLNLVLLAHA